MKKKLIAAIQAKFVGIDDNTAERLAKRILAKSESITTDDEVTVAVDAITLSDVLKSVNDFSADEAVKRYEEKYGLEKGVKKETPKPEEQKPEVKPEEKKKEDPAPDPMAAFKEMFTAFSKELNQKLQTVSDDVAAMKSGRITEGRKAKLADAIKDLKDYQKKPYGRIKVDGMTEDEFNEFLSEVKEEVSDIISENRASGGVVTPALGGGHTPTGPVKEATDAEIQALVDKFPSL